VLGPAAGVIVGPRVGHGESAPPAPPPLGVPPPEPPRGLDLALRLEGPQLGREPALAPEQRALPLVGRAREARTASEALWIETINRAHGFAQWPETPLGIVAVDAQSGARVVLSAANAPLHRAIAASCSVPGLCPPVSIEGRPYRDGAIYSPTSADFALAFEPQRVLVLAPMSAQTTEFGHNAELELQRELRVLERAGVQVQVILADAQDAEAFGPDPMDVRRAPLAFEAGRRRAELLGGLW